MKPVIREARPEDRQFIEEIARLTWEGRDYLAKVFERWLGDNFYVLDLDGKVIGTVKLTLMPQKIGWLEGLRVHPNYRGVGYGRLLHNFILRVGEDLADKGVIEALEFATYFLNRASIALAKETGFRVRAKFFDLSADATMFKPERPERTDLHLNDLNLDIVPIGWHFVEKGDEALEWIRRHAEVYSINELKFLVTKEDLSFTPLKTDLRSLELMLPAMAWTAMSRGRDRFSVMLPENVKTLLPELKSLGLRSWNDVEEPNVIVFRKDLLK